MVTNGQEFTQEMALKTLRAYQARQQTKLTDDEYKVALDRHRNNTLDGLYKYDLSDPEEFKKHSQLIYQIGQDLMLREFRQFDVDDHNKNVLKFLTFYFNGCLEAESIFPDEGYKIHKNLLLIGEPGTGKTMLMQVFADYLRLTGNVNQFQNISATQLMNYYKINSHIDKFTFNELAHPERFEGSPFNVCLNDLGLQTENQKSYGTILTQVTDEFLFARYEIYQQTGKRYHITSNLSVKDLKERFEDRLVDRFKSFNVIELRGGSRRK